MSFADEYFKLLEEEKKKKKTVTVSSKTPTQLFKLHTVNLPEPSEVKKTTTKNTGKDESGKRTSVGAGRKSTEEEEDERKWFEKGAFEDGYDFGDVTRTILGTLGDTKENLGTGIIGMGEKVVDTLAYLAPAFNASQQSQSQLNYRFDIEEYRKQQEESEKFIKKDLYDEEKIAKKLLSDPYKKIGIDTEESSVLGEKSDSLVQSAGQLGATIGLQAVGVPWFVTTGATTFGTEAENALNQGATYDEAGASAAISAGAEILSEKLGGVKFGGKALDDRLLKPLTEQIASKGLKLLATVGVKGAFEGGEEALSQFFSRLGTSLYKEENLKDILISEEAIDEYIESAVGGFVLGGTFGSVESLIETPELTENEKKVVDKIVEERVAEQENVTARQKAKIREEVIAEMDKGYLSIDTIEEVLGGDTYKAYKDTVDSEEAMFKEYEELTKEYNELGEKTGATLAEQSRYNELKQLTEEKKQQILSLKDTSQRFNLKDKLGSEVMSLVQNDRLAESYNERGRRGQAFEADLSKYDSKYHDTYKRAMESGLVNNTRRSHEFVDFIAMVEADKGLPFDFTNNKKLAEMGIDVQNATVNGFISKGGVTLNIDSKKALNSVVGHEITHTLEGTGDYYANLQNLLFRMAKSKGEYESRLQAIEKLYEGVEGADVKAELTADLVGDYLFTDPDFIRTLSVEHRNVFQKIYDEIKYLCKVATAGSKEARELAKVQKAFADAYRGEGKVQEGTKYSLTPEQEEYFKDSKVRDESGNLKVMYHGTPNGDFTVFQDGTYFTDNKDYADRYQNPSASSISSGKVASNPKTFEVYLDIKKPFDINDAEARDIYINEYIKGGNALGINPYLSDAEYDKIKTIDWTEGEDLRDFLMENGYDYDGLVLDEGADGGYGDEVNYRGKSYVVFSPEQVKNTDNLKPTSDPDIRFSLSDSDGKQLTKEQNEYFKDSKMRDDDGNLMVMYHGSQDAGFHVFDAKMSDDDTSLFFVDRNDVAASYSGTTETYEARTIRTVEDMNNFLAEIDYDHYKAVERNGRFELLENNEFVAAKDTMQELYEEFCWYEGVGEGDANYKVYLNLTNPLVVDAQGRNWDMVAAEHSQELADKYKSLTDAEKRVLNEATDWGDFSTFKNEVLDAVAYVSDPERNGGNIDEYSQALASAYEKVKIGNKVDMYYLYDVAYDNFSDDAIDKYSFVWRNTREYAAKAKAEGYDGVIFKNIHDNGGYSNGSEGASTVAIAFDSNQIKSVANEKPTSDPDIRFSLSKPVEETKDLMALHNLRAEELIKSLELGGLPMPSVAVIKAEAGHEDYGDVSLILPKETIDPQASRYNKIYGGDAWTPTYPKIEYKPSDAVSKKISDKYYELANKFGYDEVRPMYSYVNELEDALNRSRGEAAMMESLYEDTGMMQVYLQDIGKEKVQPIIKETVTEISEVQAEMNQHFIDTLGEDFVSDFGVPKGISPMAYRREFLARHEAEIRDAYKRYFTEKHGFEEAEADSVVAHTELKDLMKIMRDAYLYTQNKGVTVRTEQDYTATKEAIIKAASDGYRDWVDNLFKGVEEKNGIYNGSDYFTRSGNRKSWEALHWENTLENVVKAMRKQNQTGADALFAAHQIFATSAKDYGSIAEVKADSHRLRKISEEDYEAIKDSYTSRFAEIASRIMDKDNRNEFIAQDNAMECIVDAVRVSKTKAGIAKELKDYPQLTVTDADVEDIVSLVSDIAEMPTGYFEAKPQRAVGFDEVGVFVIPNNADVKLKQELLSRGYAIAEYDPTIEGHRQQVVNQFEEYKFSLSEPYTTPKTYGKNNVYGKDVALEQAPVKAPVTETVETPDDFAPVTEDEAEAINRDAFDSLTDEDAPPEVEAPYYGKMKDNTPADPFLDRDIGEVGNRKVKAYMYENPEVKPFFQAEAEVMLGELQNTTKGEKWYNDQLYYESGGENGWGGTKRYTSDDIAYLLDERHYTYEQIEKGLKAIIEDDGAENNAVSKRIEFLLNDRLRKGYTDFNTGMDIPANQDYIKLLNEKQITEYNEKAFNTLVADENVPPIAEESTATEDIAPMAEEPVAEEPVAEPEEQPEQIARIRKADPKKDGWWSRTKKTFNEAVSQLGDKGWVFENLSKKTGNREVEAKYDFMKNRSKGMAQEYINEHLLPIYEKVQEMGKGKEVAPVVEVNGDTVTDYMEQLDYYARHLLNIDRMSLETEAERVRRAEIRKQLEGYTERQIESIASERITKNTPQERVEQIYLAQEYVDLGGAKGKNKSVFGSPVTADVSRQMVAEYEAAHPEFKEVEQAILEYNSQLRQFAVSQGLIKKSVADKWAKMYPHYVPIRRTDKQGASVSVPLDSNRTGVNNPFKRAQGGNSDFMPLLETMALNTEQIFRAVHRNEFGKELLGALETAAAMDAEKSEDGATRQAVNAGELTAGTRVKAHDRDNIGTVKSFNPKTGKYTVFFENQQGQSATVKLDAKILTPLGNWKADNGKEVDASEVLEGTEENDNAVLTPSQNGQNPKFTVFVKGKAVTFDITEEMYKAMQPAEGILSETYAIPNKIASGYKSVLTQLDPFFALFRNPVKDTKDVFFNSQHAAKTYMTAGTTFKELVTKGKYFKEYIKNGGKTTSYYDTKAQAFVKKDSAVKKVVGFPWRAYNLATEKVEMFWRLSEYIASRKMGRSIEVSMLDAARVTTNFGAGGDLTKWANRNGAMFLNPSVQGVMQIGRNVREAYHGGLKGSAILAAKVMATGLGGLFFNWLLWDDDEDYEELSDYVKQNYFIVYKTEDGKFIRIPKGRMEAVIQNGFEQMQNLITGDDDVDMAAFADLVVNNIAPNNPLEDNLIAPIKQAVTNTAWYGGELVPTRLQDLPAAEQYDETTDSISKWIGEHTNTSPYKWNYVMQQYGGGFADMVLPMLTEEAEGSDFLAPIKDQIVSDGLMKNQNVSDFYDKRDELAVNANASGATEEDVLMNKYMNSINSELSELYAKKREIQNSDLSDSEKYEQVREIQSQIVDLTRESLNTYDDIDYQSARDGEYSNIGDRYFKLDDEGEWQKLSDDQVTKYKVTSAAGDAPYASDGTNHYRWYEPGEDSDAEAGWRKITDKQLEKQEKVTKGLGISAEEYWGNKEEYDYAYENPENYAVAKAVGGYEAYTGYSKELNKIKGVDNDGDGRSDAGTRKEKVAEYINGLDADYYTKIILFKKEYNADDTYNYEIIEYLNGRDDISREEEITILKKLGFDVDSEGNISW